MVQSHFETMRTILALCATPKKRLFLMDQTNLSRPELNSYLVMLLEYGLLEVKEKGLKATGRGLLFAESLGSLEAVEEPEIRVSAD